MLTFLTAHVKTITNTVAAKNHLDELMSRVKGIEVNGQLLHLAKEKLDVSSRKREKNKAFFYPIILSKAIPPGYGKK